MTLVRPVIRLLGEPLLVGSDGERVAFRTTKTIALLAYLVAYEGRPATRTEVAEALWPGRDPGLSHQNLRQTLLYLRGCLGPEGEEALQASRRDVRLRPGFAQCDVEAFRAALAEGPEGRERAVALYGGPFMAGFDDDWLLPARAELSHGYVRALLDLSDEMLETDAARALSYAERAIAVEPFHDGARTRKIRALRRSGEEALALREFETYEALLLEELGLRPAKTVEEALEDRVPVRKAPHRPEPPPTPGLADALGVLSLGERPQDALALAIALTPYWLEAATPAEGLRRLDEVRRSYAPEGDLSIKAGLAAAELALRSGDLDRALEELRAIEESALKPEEAVRRLILDARIHYRHREYALTRRVALRALRLARANGLSTAYAWHLLAHAHEAEERLRSARSASLRAQANAGASRRLLGRARVLGALAAAALGREGEAREELEAALKGLEGDRSDEVAVVRLSAAWQFEAFGDLDRAERGYVEGIEDCRYRDDPWALAVALTYLGDLKTRQGQALAAIRLHEEAFALREKMGDALGEATTWRGLGRARLGAGDPEGARRDLREAIRQYADLEYEPGVACCLISLAHTEVAVGSCDVARRLAQRAVRLLRGMTPAARYAVSPEGKRLLPEAEALLRELTED